MNYSKIFSVSLFLLFAVNGFSQKDGNVTNDYFINKKIITATPVKNQAATGTCWCFSTTSLVESECMLKGGSPLDLSEMFTVRNIYLEKAKNYVLRQGHAQFSEGGLGHDEIRAVDLYGAIPESVYSGLPAGEITHNHVVLSAELQKYLDSILKMRPLPDNWMKGYSDILDKHLGTPPAEFDYNGKHYNPKSFANEVVKFNADDYVFITSFTHHPFYAPFILEVPDNFSNESYYNLPLNEMTDVVKNAVDKGYTVMWDADVSNTGFMQGKGLALNVNDKIKYKNADITADMQEMPYDAVTRQRLYENLTTQDDHLMHITGTEKTKDGKTFFIVKNSWGEIGPYKGYINVSEAYFAINTVSLVIPKASLSKELLNKLKIK